jgi:hypothetical protein
MTKDIKAAGLFINYNILPVHHNVEMLLVETRKKFDQLVSKYNGKPTNKPNKPLFDSAFTKAFPFYDYAGCTRFYELKNGLLAVDQYALNKVNPYYICDNMDDHELISKYIYYARIDDSSPLIIYSKLFDHRSIKKFLTTEPLQLLTEKTNDGTRLFKTADGRFVYLIYKTKDNLPDPRILNLIGIDTSYYDIGDGDEFYSSLSIYNSEKDLDLNGELENDDDIDMERFATYSTQLIVDLKHTKPCRVVSEDSLEKILKANKFVETQLKLDDHAKNSFQLKDGSIIAQYSKFVYLQFENTKDMQQYYGRKDRHSGFLELNYETLSKEITGMINRIDDVNNEIKAAFNLESNKNSLQKELTLLDKKINRYFFDNDFVIEFFPKFAVYIGQKIIDSKGGEWLYDEKSMPVGVRLKDSKEINFIPLLFNEMLQQKYTGMCLTDAIVDGLIGGASLNVVPSRE